MKKRRIKHITVLGSGIMGSGIAAHFANIGVEVLMLDIVPNELSDTERKKGLTEESKAFRNRIATENFEKIKKIKSCFAVFSKVCRADYSREF